MEFKIVAKTGGRYEIRRCGGWFYKTVAHATSMDEAKEKLLLHVGKFIDKHLEKEILGIELEL